MNLVLRRTPAGLVMQSDGAWAEFILKSSISVLRLLKR